MSKLTVRNNWEVLEWSWGGERLNPRKVSAVVIGDIVLEAAVRERRKTVYDHGHTYSASSDDLFVEIKTPMGIDIWVSLYSNQNLLNAVSDLEFI